MRRVLMGFLLLYLLPSLGMALDLRIGFGTSGAGASNTPNTTLAGQLLYSNSTPAWALLAPGADGLCLTMASGAPVWGACSGGATGDVTAVGSCLTGACFTSGAPASNLTFNNATSGTVTLQAVTGALGTKTVSLPAATGTLALASSLDARAYGVVCTDGSVDTTTALQAAVTAAKSGTQGLGLEMPLGGICKLSASIVLDSVIGFTLHGNGVKFTWAGNTSSPMFVCRDCRESRFHGFQVEASTTATLLAVFQFENGSGSTVTPTNNTVEDVFIEGTNGGITNAIRMASGAGGNNNNDFNIFKHVSVNNVANACAKIEHSQSKHNLFEDFACANNSIGVHVIETTTGSFHCIRCQGGYSTGADFYMADTSDGVLIAAGNFEGSARLLETSGPSGAPYPVTIQSTRWVNNNLHADKKAVLFQFPGPLILLNNLFEAVSENEPMEINFNPGGSIGGFVSLGNYFASTRANPYTGVQPKVSLGNVIDRNDTNNVVALDTPLVVGQGGTGLTVGTSGGIPYFASTTTMASSALLTANALVLGGGAGATPVSLASLGTTTTVLHGNAAGAPTFAAVSLSADVSGNLPVTNLNSGTSASSSTFWRGDGTWATPAGGGNVSNTGTPTSGQLALWTASTVIQGVTALPAANFPALTGDVTTSAASLTTTLANIPTAVPMAGYLAATAIVAPGTPAVGIGRIYVDSTSKNLAVKDDVGVVKHGVQTDTGASNNFLTAISDAGVISKAQPTFTNISGVCTVAQGCTGTGSTLTGLVRGSASAMTAAELSGDVSTSGSNVVTLATVTVAKGGTGLTSGTSGGILAYTASGTLASSGALTANLPVIGGGAGVAPTVGTRSGTTTQFVTTTGPLTSGDCVKIDASGNFVANGAACGSGGSGGGTIEYSAASLTLTAGTRYAPPGGGGTPVTTESQAQVAAPAALTITNFQVTVSVAPGAGNSYAFTWRKAAADQTLTCTIADTATTCTDTTHSFSTALNDLIDVKIVSSGTIVTTPMVSWMAAVGTSGVGLTAVDSQTGPTIALTRGAGIGGSSSANTITLTTASGEADFLASGALTCGAATQGKMQVHTTPLQYCDNAGTPALQYAAYGTSTGLATAGDSATAFFTTGQLEAARGGTNVDSSASSGIAHVSSGTWTFSAVSLTADVSGILPGANGGTGNGFFAVTGPATSLKTFTLPNASATILTDNAAVTVAQGGTGAATLTGLLQGNGTSAVTVVTNSTTVGQVLRVTGANAYGWGAVDLADTDAITGILPAINGGTGNGFTAFTGPTTSTKTFTLPNATATILTDNAAVTVAQGGTGRATLTNHGVLVGAGTTAITQLAAAAAGTVLTGQGTGSDPSFTATPTLGVAGTTVGTLAFANATSGSITFSPIAGALGTVTLTIPARTATLGTTTGTLTSGNCVKFDASGNLVDHGSVCGSGGTITSGTSGNSTYYTGATTVAGSTAMKIDATSIVREVKNVTASSSSITVGDHNVIACDATAANRTYTLPAASGLTLGQTYRVIKIDSGSNTCIFAPASGERLNGVVDSTKSTAVQFEDIQVILVSTSTPNWQVSASVLSPLSVANGGSGAATLTGLLQGNGTSVFTAITNSTTVGQILRVTGSNAYGWGALDLADTDAVTGILPGANGGTGNGFFAVSGPATSLKTFTFPNASATVLTTNAAVTVAQGGTGLASGTSGGIPYFSGSTTIASSAALTASAIVLGGGAGASPTVLGSLGTTTTVLHGNAAGAPTFAAVSLTADVSGILPGANGGTGNGFFAVSGPATSLKTFTLPNATATILTDNAAVTVAQGGTGTTTLTGLLVGNGTSAFTVVTAPSGAVVGTTDTQTLTGKTYDAEATGNVLTTVSKIWLPAVGCLSTTGSLLWDTLATNAPTATCSAGSTETTMMRGVADFPDSDGDFSLQQTIALPDDWTGALDAKIKYRTTATSGNTVWQVATACRADAEVDDVAYNTASASAADAAKGTTNQLNDVSITGITTTGCAAGELMHFKVFRNRTHASDSITGVVSLVGVELTLRRAQ